MRFCVGEMILSGLQHLIVDRVKTVHTRRRRVVVTSHQRRVLGPWRVNHLSPTSSCGSSVSK